jgi:hypothetical protein
MFSYFIDLLFRVPMPFSDPSLLSLLKPVVWRLSTLICRQFTGTPTFLSKGFSKIMFLVHSRALAKNEPAIIFQKGVYLDHKATSPC